MTITLVMILKQDLKEHCRRKLKDGHDLAAKNSRPVGGFRRLFEVAMNSVVTAA